MPQVDLAVITGGQGSVQTAMATGTPFVGLPLQPEQEFNVSLAVRHGMALALGPRTATVASVAGAVRSLSTRPSHRECARRVQGHYAGVDGAALAARALRAHLATHAPRPGQTPSPTV
jgi:UDP:flavonoid glycosyltransferase YjiC (YdhE family)